MPRLPILDRTRYFTRNDDGSLRELEWCLVNTSLGAMVESRSRTITDVATIVDVQDTVSYNRILEVDESSLYSALGTYGVNLGELLLHNPLP